MTVLVRVHGSPEHRFLVRLTNKKLIKVVNNLVDRGRYLKAIVTILSKGIFLKEVLEYDLPHIKADLILTENHVYRDVT